MLKSLKTKCFEVIIESVLLKLRDGRCCLIKLFHLSLKLSPLCSINPLTVELLLNDSLAFDCFCCYDFLRKERTSLWRSRRLQRAQPTVAAVSL